MSQEKEVYTAATGFLFIYWAVFININRHYPHSYTLNLAHHFALILCQFKSTKYEANKMRDEKTKRRDNILNINISSTSMILVDEGHTKKFPTQAHFERAEDYSSINTKNEQ